MKIIGGNARGRTIRLPAGCRIRPTSDRIKKSLFDILNPVEGKTFLDLFAGSGNVGLEAISRGARFVFFVERDRRLTDVIRTNLIRFECRERAEVIENDVERGLAVLRQRGVHTDIVFADPPYNHGWVSSLFQWMNRGDLLTPNGIMIVQHSKRESPEETDIGQMSEIDRRTYGDTVLSFFRAADS